MTSCYVCSSAHCSPTEFGRHCRWGTCDTCHAVGMIVDTWTKLPKTLQELPDGYRAYIRELAKDD